LMTFLRTGAARAGLLILLLAVVACGGAREPESHAGQMFPFAARIGWLHGSCLAIRNADLARGTPVDVVILAEPQRVEQARVGERTDSPQRCQALILGRAKVNAKPGMFFYALEAGDLGSRDMGIGIVEPPAHPQTVNGLARVDLDQDGRREIFSSCATTEGIKFAVWTEKAYRGEPRWSAYYYLDDETTPTCP
jgi:hypothetical protein